MHKPSADRGSEPATKGRVVVCSYGLNGDQLTPETLAALRQCDVVYSEPLPSALKKSLDPILATIEPSKGLAADDLIERMIALAKKGRRVAYLTYGDPAICNRLCDKLVDRCEAEALESRVYRGISYLNEILGALRLVGESRVGVYVTQVPSKRYRLSVDVPALVLQFGVGAVDGGGAARLLNEIRRVYPPSFEAEVVTASADSGALSRLKCRVDDLSRAWEAAGHRGTLYLPSRAEP
jgi:hypothetical protein